MKIGKKLIFKLILIGFLLPFLWSNTHVNENIEQIAFDYFCDSIIKKESLFKDIHLYFNGVTTGTPTRIYDVIWSMDYDIHLGVKNNETAKFDSVLISSFTQKYPSSLKMKQDELKKTVLSNYFFSIRPNKIDSLSNYYASKKYCKLHIKYNKNNFISKNIWEHNKTNDSYYQIDIYNSIEYNKTNYVIISLKNFNENRNVYAFIIKVEPNNKIDYNTLFYTWD
ncbi:MAG: hypothetical protein RSA66_10775 [Muribaculaceae bacterium]